MHLGLGLTLLNARRSGARVFDTVIVVDITGESGTLDLVVTAPVDYAGTYTINLTDLATEPQLVRAAPAPTGTQAIGETLTGRPALWAIADGETIEIERRWWKGNGPLLDQGGHPPEGDLLYDCEWHSDAQEPFRIDERARYVADPEATWSEWQEGDETTPPDPSPFLSGSFVDPATRELWACSPHTTQVGLRKIDGNPAVRARNIVQTVETINPQNAVMVQWSTAATTDLSEVHVRQNSLWLDPGRGIDLDLSAAAIDWNNRSELTVVQGVMFTQPTVPTEAFFFHTYQTGSWTFLRLRTSGQLQASIAVGGGNNTQAEVSGWAASNLAGASVENPVIVVVGMRRKGDITSLWVNGSQVEVEAGAPSYVGQTFDDPTPKVSMAGMEGGGGDPGVIGALISGTFFSVYGLSDAEMAAVSGHIARASGGTS